MRRSVIRRLLAGTAGIALAASLTACQTAGEAYRAPIEAAKAPATDDAAPTTAGGVQGSTTQDPARQQPVEQDQEQTASPAPESDDADFKSATREGGGGTYTGTLSDYRIEDLSPGERPDITSDEADIWMMMDRAERRAATSGRVIDDPALNAYVGKMVCDLAGDYCDDIRLYIMRVPEFNATMGANGMMSVYSGLLLRARNEAQLATVLGHEIGHFLRRHSYQRIQDLVNKTTGLAFFQLFTAALGVPVVGSVASLAAQGSLASFSRDNEREADGYGLLLMGRAGYSPHEAAKIWDNLNAELGDEKREQSFFYSTHPETSERQSMLRALAGEVPVAGGGDGKIGTDAYREALSPHWHDLLADEVSKRDYGRTERLFDSLIAEGFRAGAVYYYKGEMYRQRGEEGDEDLALAAYHAATQFADAPAEVYKARGQIFQRKGLKAEARESYSEYVRLNPGAKDRKMIEFMIGGLGS